jgi:hypothetical protein
LVVVEVKGVLKKGVGNIRRSKGRALREIRYVDIGVFLL